MKQIYHIYIALIANCLVYGTIWGPYYHAAPGPRNESIDAARNRFDRMTVRQIRHVSINDLTPNQKQGFKELATEYFMSEVIRPGCSNQAHRRKYEIMYNMIGQMYEPSCL